ncbi:MAG: type II toxin-antitoxin system HipA family toxin [Desulfuromonadaceae bacterium]|nr:type II toxin-antitoxin system HipA family toxin [Desulfuromonadaceae bacterium]
MGKIAEQLEGYLSDRCIGMLSRENGRLAFLYDRQWLADPHSHPLSLSLPLREAPFSDLETRTWFGNLLPEGDFLNTVARRLGRSTGDIFGLLVDLGGECAGAISLLPPGKAAAETGGYQPFREDELFALVSADPPLPLLAGETGVRLSLAGAQNKVPVYVEGNSILKATGSLATSHILKPPIRAAISLPHTVENEAFCMQLAGKLGLIVPNAQVRTIHNLNFYLVERFDRRREQGRVERLHQEDFCQALEVEANLKYEDSGGPGMSAIWHLLRSHSAAPAVDGRQLLRWLAFNFLIGNADAHGKNLALLYDKTGSVRLAPFYDLLCTAVYPELDQRMAMRLGGERRPDRLRRKHWERLAEELGVSPRAVFGELEILTQTIEKTSEALAVDFNDRYSCGDTMNRILEIIRRRSGRAWAFLGGRPCQQGAISVA